MMSREERSRPEGEDGRCSLAQDGRASWERRHLWQERHGAGTGLGCGFPWATGGQCS